VPNDTVPAELGKTRLAGTVHQVDTASLAGRVAPRRSMAIGLGMGPEVDWGQRPGTEAVVMGNRRRNCSC
jgi:hypothetical protein